MDIPCTQPLLDELDDEEIVEESEKAKIGLLIVRIFIEFDLLGVLCVLIEMQKIVCNVI